MIIEEMDRRNWLWRRKSSERSPGETESTGSISSLSERFSDDQVYPTQAALSPEVTSKVGLNEEPVTDVKILTDKLAAAIRNISAKEDTVKQHSKVAEEAVTGWEKAENEVSALRQQLDAAKQKNSILDDRVGHFDGALKECMRQLRQAREEQEQKIHEAVANNSHDWESKKSELEGKIAELEAQLQAAKADPAAPVLSSLQKRLEAIEKENSVLKIELQSRLEEVEFRIAERDLSAQAAETASKQHLESIKKVAKLEAECRRLKTLTRKPFSINDQRSLAASSVYVESFTDSMSDSGERLLAVESDMHKLGGWEMNECEPSRSDSWTSALATELGHFKNEKSTGKNNVVPSTDISLMDDFVEMERLAALQDTEKGSNFVGAGVSSDQLNVGQGTVQAEMEVTVQKSAELEKKLRKIEADKLEVEMSLTECQIQLEASEGRIREADLKVTELQTQLAFANKSNQEAFDEIKATRTIKEIAESKLRFTQTEVEKLISKISSLEKEIQQERALSTKNLIKCEKLENELLSMKREAQVQQDAEILRREGVKSELKLKQEKELALASSKFAECQKTIASLGQRLKSLATFEDFLHDSDKPMELTSEVAQAPQTSGEELKLHSDLTFHRKASESPIPVKSSITHQKNRNNGYSKVVPRSKSVSRTRRQ
ncbi:putative filament-like plant protein [Lupinus albus]|uniref:Putative filament-like plant protein n=1 Tax=Lupinus albus TaxID=3870 RepID=A0A6A4Q8V1_LUPAL|nr:putative filament-like plant protein [Lupinus albus]